jgi:hypothetical protein
MCVDGARARRRISESDSTAIRPGHAWFLIDKAWLTRWHRFVSAVSTPADPYAGPAPTAAPVRGVSPLWCAGAAVAAERSRSTEVCAEGHGVWQESRGPVPGPNTNGNLLDAAGTDPPHPPQWPARRRTRPQRLPSARRAAPAAIGSGYD